MEHCSGIPSCWIRVVQMYVDVPCRNHVCDLHVQRTRRFHCLVSTLLTGCPGGPKPLSLWWGLHGSSVDFLSYSLFNCLPFTSFFNLSKHLWYGLGIVDLCKSQFLLAHVFLTGLPCSQRELSLKQESFAVDVSWIKHVLVNNSQSLWLQQLRIPLKPTKIHRESTGNSPGGSSRQPFLESPGHPGFQASGDFSHSY